MRGENKKLVQVIGSEIHEKRWFLESRKPALHLGGKLLSVWVNELCDVIVLLQFAAATEFQVISATKFCCFVLEAHEMTAGQVGTFILTSEYDCFSFNNNMIAYFGRPFGPCSRLSWNLR